MAGLTADAPGTQGWMQDSEGGLQYVPVTDRLRAPPTGSRSGRRYSMQSSPRSLGRIDSRTRDSQEAESPEELVVRPSRGPPGLVNESAPPTAADNILQPSRSVSTAQRRTSTSAGGAVQLEDVPVGLPPAPAARPGPAKHDQQDVPIAGGSCSWVPRSVWWLVLLGLLLLAGAAVAMGVVFGRSRCPAPAALIQVAETVSPGSQVVSLAFNGTVTLPLALSATWLAPNNATTDCSSAFPTQEVSAAYSSTLSGQVAAAMELTQQGVTAVGLLCDGMPVAADGRGSSRSGGNLSRVIDVTAQLQVGMQAPKTTSNITVPSNSSGPSQQQLSTLFNQYLEQLTPLADAALLSCDAVPIPSAWFAAAQAAFGDPVWGMVGFGCDNRPATATVSVVNVAPTGGGSSAPANEQQQGSKITLGLQYMGGGVWQVVEEGGAAPPPPHVPPST